MAIAGDPGGANALRPALRQIASEGRIQLRPLAYRQAVALWDSAGLAPERVDGWTDNQLMEVLAKSRPALVVVATSLNAEQIEVRCTSIAQRLSFPTLGVLDFWSAWTERFAPAPGKSLCFPDELAVMDDRARQRMEQAGLPSRRMLVVGQPAFDGVAARAVPLAGKAPQTRQRLGVPPEGRLALFLSQPIEAVYGQGLGYTESSVLTELAAALKRTSMANLHVAVRPHPREDPTALGAICQGLGFHLAGPEAGTTQELAMAADLVLGMNTAFLVESCLLGRPTLSIQPGLRQEDALSAATAGALEVVREPADLAPALARYLAPGAHASAAKRLLQLPDWSGSTARLVGAIYQRAFRRKP